MTTGELIEILQTQPADAVVLVYVRDGPDAGAWKEVEKARPLALRPGIVLNAKGAG